MHLKYALKILFTLQIIMNCSKHQYTFLNFQTKIDIDYMLRHFIWRKTFNMNDVIGAFLKYIRSVSLVIKTTIPSILKFLLFKASTILQFQILDSQNFIKKIFGKIFF